MAIISYSPIPNVESCDLQKKFLPEAYFYCVKEVSYHTADDIMLFYQ